MPGPDEPLVGQLQSRTMTSSSRSTDGGARPTYEPPRVGKARRLDQADPPLVLIYFSGEVFRTLISQVASTPTQATPHFQEITLSPNVDPWVVAARLIKSMHTRTLAEVASSVELDESELYPGRGVMVNGSVLAAPSVTPSGFDVSVHDAKLRILVDRAQGLHLNQRFLTLRQVWILGRVVSVPRRQIRAAAVAIERPKRSQSVGTIVGLSSDNATD